MRIHFVVKFVIAVVLSIAALPMLVNAQARTLSSVNNDKASTKVAQLIAITLKNGVDDEIRANAAPVFGLTKAMPVRVQEITLYRRDRDAEQRLCYVVYENVESSTAAAPTTRAVCAYLVKYKRSSTSSQSRYFRMDLSGKLEKAILSEGKFDEAGKVVRGSGVKTDLDIEAPEVRKTFNEEMNFWLNDWLKKELKAGKKAAAASAAPAPPADAPL